jgi:hypothetical protein
LLLKMAKDDPLNCHCSCGDSSTTERSCDQAEHESTNATKPIASATRTIAALKLGPEYGTVPLFVRLELDQLCDHTWRGDSSEDDLTGIDSLRRG